MSLTQNHSTDKLAAKQNRRNIHVFDSTNIEDFFRQPSPDELKVTSEIRVLEIIEDLKKLTTEELENWSQGQDVTYAPLPPPKMLKTSDSVHKEGFHGGDMVSSPISLSSPLPLAKSNLMSVSRSQANQGTSNTQFTKCAKEGEFKSSAEKKDPLALSDKPSFQSFLKRVAKTPPPQALSRVLQNPEAIPAVPKPTSQWPEIDVADEYGDDEICVRIKRSNTPPPPPKFATRRNLYDSKESSVEGPENSDSGSRTKKPRPRSNSMPMFLIKRKPLPKNSTLFAPRSAAIRRAPTFDDIMFDTPVCIPNTNKSRSQSESEMNQIEHSLPLPPVLMSTLSRGKSIGKKIRTHARIIHHS